MSPPLNRWVSLIATLVVVTPARAHANDTQTADGVYGRLSGDATLSAEVTGGIAGGSFGARPLVGGTLRVRALDMAGIFVAYDYTAGGTTRFDAVSAGLDLRPLVFARIFQAWESGPRTVDLIVDSIGLELGASWVNPGDPWRVTSGFAYLLGAGVEAPLWWNNGTGVMVRASVRWSHADPGDAQAGEAANVVMFGLGLVIRTMPRLGLLGVR